MICIFFLEPILKELKTDTLICFYTANANYELGRGDNHARCKPTLIPELENMHIVQVACGGYHSVVLTGPLFFPS